MARRIQTIVLDSAEPEVVARFWAGLLGLDVVRVDGRWIDLAEPGGTYAERVLSVQHAPDHRPPTWPDPEVPQQIHLDIEVDDADAAEADVVRLGGRRIPWHEPGYRVCADPSGHVFCLVAPTG